LLDISQKIFVEYLPEEFCWISPWRFICWIFPWRWPKRTKHIGSSPLLYIIVTNYSAVVEKYMVTCLTVQNVGNFKFDPYILQSEFQFRWQLHQENITHQNRHAMCTFPSLLYLHYLLPTLLLFHLRCLWV